MGPGCLACSFLLVLCRGSGAWGPLNNLSWIHQQDYASPEDLGVASEKPKILLLSPVPDTSGHSLSLMYQVSGVSLAPKGLSFLP